MKKFLFSSLLGIALMVDGDAVQAHGPVQTIEIGSTADGGGSLASFFHFHTRVARLSYSATVGPNSIYTGALPAFQSLPADDAPDLYVLDPGTQVTVQVTAIDEGVSTTINGTPLASVGDSAVLGTEPIGHTHPTWTLSLALPEGSFGEGSISFKLTASGGYGESEIYTLKLTNGPLPAPDYSTTSVDKAAIACRLAVSKNGQKFFDKKLALMRKCLDKIQVKEAKEALTTPPADLASAEATAEAVCVGETGTPAEDTLLGKIDAAKTKAFLAIQSKCADAGALSDDDIQQQLGLVGCRAEELAASMYGNAQEGMAEYTTQASQGGSSLDKSFPCVMRILAE